VLGMLAWCGVDTVHDLVLPPAAATQHGVVLPPGVLPCPAPDGPAAGWSGRPYGPDGPESPDGPQYAAHSVEAYDIPESFCYPAIRSLPVLLKELELDTLPPKYESQAMKVKELLLETLRGEPNCSPSYPEHGRVISEPRLKDSLNRPRFDASGGSA
jgi:hypothetical protein